MSGNPEDVVLRQGQLCRKYDNLHYYLTGVTVDDAQFENVRWAIDENMTPLVTRLFAFEGEASLAGRCHAALLAATCRMIRRS